MKEFYRFCSMVVFCLGVCMFSVFKSQAQYYSEEPRQVSITSNCGGFYEFLPPGYSASSGTYPIMIFLHGAGEVGNGGSDLAKVLVNGPPKLITAGTFPTNFTVNGITSTFIIICPQFVQQASISDVAAVIDYSLSHYRADQNRLYLTGLSMGGGETWSYTTDNSLHANKLAAIAVISGSNEQGPGNMQVIASANLPVFASHNLNDPTVPSSYTVNNINWINNSNPPPTPRAVDTIFNVSGHDAWTTTYDPTIPMHNGLNVYQWMLQYSRVIVPLPVDLSVFTAVLSTDHLQVLLHWTTANEENNRYFIIQRSADGTNFTDLDSVPAANLASGSNYSYTDRAPLTPDNFYRLAQVDLDGKTTFYSVLKVTIPTTGKSLFKISPNPVANTLYLELAQPGSGSLTVSLSDAAGKTLRVWKFQKAGTIWDQAIDVSFLPAGNYFIHIRGDQYEAVQQFIRK